MQGSGKKILQAIALNSQQPVEQQSSRKIVRKQQESNTSKSRRNKENIENHSPNHNHKTVSTKSKKKVNSPSYKEKYNQQALHSNVTHNSVVNLNTTPSAEITDYTHVPNLERVEAVSKAVEGGLNERTHIVKVSLCNDFDINTKDEFGFTQLHHAVDEGDLRAVKLLISKGANIYVKDKCGQTPFQLAKELMVKNSNRNRREIATLLTSVRDKNKKQINHLTKKVNELSLTNYNNQKLASVAQDIKEGFSTEGDTCLSESKIFKGGSMGNNVIQDGDLNNKSLEFEADNSELISDEKLQATITRFDEALPQLTKLQELYRKYSKSLTKTPTEKRLIDNYREFITNHPDINLGRSNIANLKTICAHGTNAWTVFSAFAFTNLQLLPKFAMKVRGIPIGAGELISEKEKAKFYRHTSYPNTISQNFVSTVWLGSKDSALAEIFDYADKSTKLYKHDYDKFKEKLLKKCKDQNIVQELKEVLESDSMNLIYEDLSSIPVVIIGNGIGGVGVGSSISGETGYERVDIRIIAISKVLQVFIQKLIEKINPKKSKDVALLTIEELDDFERNRPKKGKPTCYMQGLGSRSIPIGVHENTFTHDFLNTFGDKLPFNTSDKFDRIPIERTILRKETIQGKLSSYSASEVGYYKASPNISVTYDEEDSSYLNAEVASNLHPINEQKCDEIEDIQQPKIQSLTIENFNSAEDLSFKPTSYIEPLIFDVSSSTIDDDSQVMDSKIVNSNQPQVASSMKKAVYATMIISPFIAVGIYTAVALSAGIVKFNPIVAAGIFVGVIALSAICFATAKACGKVSEEKSENSGVRSYIASNNGIFSECFKSSGATVS
ncbi:ankyrin repeat domain-containing protein [Candidatus Mesenet endosymbiont of Phosphuga atrata]|uniref:ankyrin repeat domain-containing protein n=1 Tax=Candidatus Mesenet endosymbiont of Phosphuga atrata TaxID=3066221 RepID=UPI0030CB7A28